MRARQRALRCYLSAFPVATMRARTAVKNRYALACNAPAAADVWNRRIDTLLPAGRAAIS